MAFFQVTPGVGLDPFRHAARKATPPRRPGTRRHDLAGLGEHATILKLINHGQLDVPTLKVFQDGRQGHGTPCII